MNKEQQKQLEMHFLNQHLEQLQEQIQTIKTQLTELIRIKESLEELKKTKNKSAIVPLGAGVFVESDLKEIKEVILNIGSNVLIKKEIGGAKEILKNQINELQNIAHQMENSLAQGIMKMNK